VRGAAGGHLIAQDEQELGELGVRQGQGPRPVDERRLRLRRAPVPPEPLGGHLGEQLLARVPRRELGAQLRPEPLEIRAILAGHRRRPRPQSMPQPIATRHRLAGGGPGPGAFQGVAAVGGDLGGAGHGVQKPGPSLRSKLQ
jgi:hypothetical protein